MSSCLEEDSEPCCSITRSRERNHPSEPESTLYGGEYIREGIRGTEGRRKRIKLNNVYSETKSADIRWVRRRGLKGFEEFKPGYWMGKLLTEGLDGGGGEYGDCE